MSPINYSTQSDIKRWTNIDSVGSGGRFPSPNFHESIRRLEVCDSIIHKIDSIANVQQTRHGGDLKSKTKGVFFIMIDKHPRTVTNFDKTINFPLFPAVHSNQILACRSLGQHGNTTLYICEPFHRRTELFHSIRLGSSPQRHVNGISPAFTGQSFH